MTVDSKISDAFDALFKRFDNMSRLLQDPPLLAHYTSIPVIESILRDEVVWLSNPLFMNDVEEIRFGVNQGRQAFNDRSRLMLAAGTEERAEMLSSAFGRLFTAFDTDGAFDTYVFCLCEHDRGNDDGLLSMWRGYGSHGNGAALVFDTSKVAMIPGSPLTLATVTYASIDERITQIDKMLDEWSEITKSCELPDDALWLPAFYAFHLITTYALTTKHNGFSEEREWRLIYQANQDQAGLLKEFLSYHIAPRGVEPKLKWKIGPIPNVSSDTLSLETVLSQIILGPSLASHLSGLSIKRMLDKIGKPQFKELVCASTIPLRPL